MFVFENLCDLNKDWYFGDKRRYSSFISQNLLQWITNYHLIGIQFLFENFARKRGGAILNQDKDMNMIFQVCVFFHFLKDKISENSPVLILCSDCSMCKWLYHCSQVGLMSNIPEKCQPAKFHVITYESKNWFSEIPDQDFLCIVVDDIDILPNKRFLKKLRGVYNIGLTERNFYVNPDQKLKWTLLDWVSPGCVGKLNDFYSIDRLHSLAFADNYRFWWCRLNWNFCKSFERPTVEELQEYEDELSKWCQSHGVKYHTSLTLKPNKTKRKLTSTNENKRRKTVQKSVVAGESTNSKNVSPSNKNPINVTEIVSNEIFEELIGSSKKVSQLFKTEIDSDDQTEIDRELINKPKDENFDDSEDEEEPILSIINSQVDIDKKVTTNDSEIHWDSSDSDTDFLTNMVKKKSNITTVKQSQDVSGILDYLSDVEGNAAKDSDDDSFFSELISGKKNQNLSSS